MHHFLPKSFPRSDPVSYPLPTHVLAYLLTQLLPGPILSCLSTYTLPISSSVSYSFPTFLLSTSCPVIFISNSHLKPNITDSSAINLTQIPLLSTCFAHTPPHLGALPLCIFHTTYYFISYLHHALFSNLSLINVRYLTFLL